MSTCISMHGEFGSHELTGRRAERFVCQRCGVLDEDGIMDALDAAGALVASAAETSQHTHDDQCPVCFGSCGA